MNLERDTANTCISEHFLRLERPGLIDKEGILLIEQDVDES